MILTFLDTETTGLPEKEPFLSSPELGPEVVEYAIADWCDGELTNIEHRLVVPRNIQEVATEDEDGIWRTPDGFPLRYRADHWRAEGAIKWNDADTRRMHQRLARKMLAGSNPGFDQARLQWEITRTGGGRVDWEHRMVGTEHLAIFMIHQGLVQSRGLVALAEYFEIEHDAHTALGDLQASVAVFERMVDLYIYHPRVMREALEVIAEASPDADMASYAARAARGEEPE